MDTPPASSNQHRAVTTLRHACLGLADVLHLLHSRHNVAVNLAALYYAVTELRSGRWAQGISLEDLARGLRLQGTARRLATIRSWHLGEGDRAEGQGCAVLCDAGLWTMLIAG